MALKFGYNTNGFGFHRLDDAIDIIAELGYDCIGLTLDVHHCDPFHTTTQDLQKIRRRLEKHGLACVIETGARYLLDPRHKHRPTLLDNSASSRLELMKRALEIAQELEAICVSYWSGARPEGTQAADDELFERLAQHVITLEASAEERGVLLALEPEPGFLVESMTDFEHLCELTGRRLGLTLDVGHVVCVEEKPPQDFVRQYVKQLRNIQLDDMRKGNHRHLMFGEGEVDFSSFFAALAEIKKELPACVELSEHSRVAVQTARESRDFLRQFEYTDEA